MIKIISSEKDLSILVPEKLARKYNLYPIEINDDDLEVGIEDENIYAVQDLRLVTNKNIILRKKSKEEIKYDLIEQITLSFDEAETTLRNIF